MPIRIAFIFLLSALVFGAKATGYAQNPLDGYKYIIVPKKFDFLRKENQYRVNSQTKYLFDKNGYNTVLKGVDYPEDLIANPCLGVEANVIDESNSFTSKVRISLTNCQDKVVHTSEQGRSKEKEYAKSYSIALENAFKSIAAMGYNYNPELSLIPSFASAENQATKVKEQSVEPESISESASVPESETVSGSETVSEPETVSKSKPVSEPKPAEVAAVAAAVPVSKESETTESGPVGAVTYGNENIAFFLIDQGDKLAAYVVRSTSDNYGQGEKIGTFERTSLPNVYRVEWKDMDKDIEQTTGYFDEQGNLKIDVKRDGKVEVLTFVKE